MSITRRKVIIVDCETTGLRASDEVIQFSALLPDTGHTFSCYIMPTQDGIDNMSKFDWFKENGVFFKRRDEWEDLCTKYNPELFLRELVGHLVDGRDFILGKGVAFDVARLRSLYHKTFPRAVKHERYDAYEVIKGSRVRQICLDTAALLKWGKVKSLSDYYPEADHSAENDCIATQKLAEDLGVFSD